MIKPDLNGREVSLVGVIIPSEWGEEGDVTSIKLCTLGEIDYEIYQNKKGKALMRNLQSNVRVRCSVRNKKIGTEIIISEYKILTNNNDQGDDNEAV